MSYYYIKLDKLRRQYKKHSSGFEHWGQVSHAEYYMLVPRNISDYLSIDEVSLSNGEPYTFVTNKKRRSKQGAMVTCIKGIRAGDNIKVLEKLPLELRKQFSELTLDMAKNMESAVKTAFPEATLATDRFHVVKLAIESLQHLRIKQRWTELDKENKAIEQAKKDGKKYRPIQLSNGDTPKQLLAKSRYIITKKTNDWTSNQKQRAALLFGLCPHLEKAYKHTLEFRSIYENADKLMAGERFKMWI